MGNLRANTDAGAYSYSNDFPNVRSTASYLVDVVVQYPEPAFVAGAQTPLPGSSSVALNTAVSATFSKPATAASVQFALTGPGGTNIPGTTNYDPATGKVTFTPSAQLVAATSYTANLTATSTTNQPLSAGGTWTFTTVPLPRTDGVCPCTLYQDTVTPTVLEVKDGAPLALGVRFASSTSGQVTGIRFYKSAGNTGTHTGSLFSITGQQLATVTFTAESSAGWQTATFSQPVAITADTEYVAAYKSPTGTYSATPGGFTTGFTSGPLRTAADSGGFSYSGDFPGSSSSSSYLVDLVFQTSGVAPPPPPEPLTVTAQSPAPNATAVALNVQPSLTVSSAVQPGASLTLAVGGTSIAGASALSADGRTVTFTPAQQLPANDRHHGERRQCRLAGGRGAGTHLVAVHHAHSSAPHAIPLRVFAASDRSVNGCPGGGTRGGFQVLRCRVCHGHPFLQRDEQHGHAHRLALDGVGRAAGQR